MTRENSSDPRAVPAQEIPEDPRPSVRPATRNSPPRPSDGLELPRSSHC